ncbi:hypothetical protein NQX30_01750 [Candidatus Persebacteraceae bacterium Df01]|jgi:hypothetical protein|uniref:NfeD-like C-terminal domain-containing protein n=1 Tax=Candidatus Doriopsillibacter californiensis TaxID=2970740 RepID=A0ABT7QL17_9GAMM|nr:hypothetical protein [Candidatus Persebacteraceae bacterium Df01]
MENINLLWWHWAIVGSLLLTLDVLLINVYYIIWFGIGALTVAILLVFFPELSMAAQIASFGIFALIFLGLWIFFLRPQRSRRLIEEAKRELPGCVGIVVRFNDGQGLMRLQRPIGGRDLWNFVSQQPLHPGEKVVADNVGDDAVVVAKEKE